MSRPGAIISLYMKWDYACAIVSLVIVFMDWIGPKGIGVWALGWSFDGVLMELMRYQFTNGI